MGPYRTSRMAGDRSSETGAEVGVRSGEQLSSWRGSDPEGVCGDCKRRDPKLG